MNEQTQEQVYDNQYPAKDFDKKIYSFSAAEIRNLATFVTITQMGKIAEQLANNFVSNEVIKRLGVTTTIDSGVLYDVAQGSVTTYIPKVICSECKARRAEFSYKDKVYCQTCVDLVKKPEVKPEAVVEKTAKKKK